MKFHLGDVLSITDGHLLSPEGMVGVHNILNYMTGEDLFTHSLLRAAEICRPALVLQHPSLTEIKMPQGLKIEQIEEWLDDQKAIYGSFLDVEPITDWEKLDPLEELIRLMS